MPRLRLAALVVVAATAALSLCVAAPAVAQPRVVIAFLPIRETVPSDPTIPRATILDVLDARKQLSLGLTGASQGGYLQEQALLDMGAGTRTSAAAYNSKRPTTINYFTNVDGNGIFLGWPDVLKRADSASAEIHPGLFGSSVPGGIGYAGVAGRRQVEAVVAVDGTGTVKAPSIGPARNVARRGMALLQDHRVVVIGLPTGDPGARQLDSLIAHRATDELLIVMQTPPSFRAPQLLPTGIVGLGKPQALTSESTHQPGLVAGIDLMATALDHIGVKVPDSVKGQPITLTGKRDAAGLQKFADRLRVVSPRRFPALEAMMATWLLLLLLGGVLADRRGVRWAMRVGGLAWCWLLGVLLFTAVLAPSRSTELILVASVSFGLGLATERLLSWRWALLLPCAATVLAYTADLANGSHLIVRSILGPNPRFGSRYYGLGNELEATLPILLLIALAVVFYGRGRSRAGAYTFGVVGVIFGAVVGSGRLGADVGGVLTVGAGTAVAVLCMLPGGLTRRAGILAVLALPAAVIVLAGLDLATGGDGHFTRTVLHADGPGALWDIVTRRYSLAFNVFKRGLMPLATIIAGLALIYGVRYRERVYAPIADDPAWRAALLGSLAAAIAGTLFNDSGPLLLLFGAFLLAVVTAYLRGDPQLAQQTESGPRVTAGQAG